MQTRGREITIFLLFHVIHENPIQRRLLALLRPDYFQFSDTRAAAIVVRCLLDYYKETGRIPGKEALSALISDLLFEETNPETLGDALALVDCVYRAPPPGVLDPTLAQRFFNHLVAEYYKIYLQTSLVNTPQNRLDELLKTTYDRYRNACSLAAYPTELIPEDISCFFRTQDRVSTGIPFLDEYMDGGMQPGEVYTVLGCTGSGKTILGLQLTYSTMLSIPSNDEVAVFYSYELPRDMVIARVVSMVSNIPISRLQTIYSDPTLAGEIGQPDEFDRIHRAIAFLNKYCYFRDFSGEQIDGRVYGGGGIPEVAADIEAIQQEGRRVRTVVIDWSLAMIRREISLGRKNHDRIVHYLSSFVQDFAIQIARRYNCSVWIFHQLSAESSKRSLHHIPDHTDAEWCKSFANYAWYSFSLSREDIDTHLQYIACTKARRSMMRAPTVIRKTDYLAFEDVSGDYKFIPGVGIRNRR